MNVFPPPDPNFKRNLNTWISGLTLLGLVFGGVGTLWTMSRWVGKQENLILTVQAEQTRLRDDVESRETVVAASLASINADVRAIDKRLTANETASMRLLDRQSASEARNNELATTLRDLQAAIASQGGDIKVILAWIEEQRRRGPQP